jgi:hypothetical protein
VRDPWAGHDVWGEQAPPQAPGPRGRQDPRRAQDPRARQAGRGERDPRAAQAGWGDQDPRAAWDEGYPQQAGATHAAHRAAESAAEVDRAVAADRRLSTIGRGRAILVGSAQILALLPGISRDGIVTVAGMGRGLSREDAVRFSFLLSAPVILAAGVLKANDLFGPMGKGIHGPVLVGSLLAGLGAYFSVRFLTRYFSEDRSLNPFGIYCLVAGLGSLAYLLLK